MEVNSIELISVIIPIYNVQDYLERCISSVIAQTYKNLQIILINDGSTDNSLEICQKFAEQDPRIEVISKENGGLSDARNVGIDNSCGSYVSFIDSDDFVHERFIEKMYSCIKRDNSDMCICGFNPVIESDVVFPEMTLGSPKSYPDFAGLMEGIHHPTTVMKTISATPLVVAWNKLYCRKLFSDIRFPDGRLHEDEFVVHHIVDACRFISVTADNLYYYLQRATGIMGERFTVRNLDVLDAYDERLKFYLKNNTHELIRCTCLGYIRRYVEAYNKLSMDATGNIRRWKECSDKFRSNRKAIIKHGGLVIVLRYLLAAINPKSYQALSGFLNY